MRRAALWLLVIALVLIGADRGANAYAEVQAAVRLQPQLGAAMVPRVRIASWPFLTQLAARDLREVHAEAEGVRLQRGGRAVELSAVRLDLGDVRIGTDRSLTADRVTAYATIDWSTASRSLKAPLSHQPDGRVKVQAAKKIYGQTLRLDLSGRPVVDARTHRLTLTEARADLQGKPVPQEIVTETIDELVGPLQLPEIEGFAITGVESRPEGLVWCLQAEHLRLK